MSATILLPIQRILDELKDKSSIGHISEDTTYMELSFFPYPSESVCKLFADYGYWETHEFGALSSNDKYLNTYKGYKYKEANNKDKYRSGMLAFWENRDNDVFEPEVISSKIYLKMLKGRIVAIGILMQPTHDTKRIYLGTGSYVNTLDHGKLHLFVPRRCRNKGYASELADYINSRLKTYASNTVPVIRAMGRALDLLQKKLDCPVTARSMEHCSYDDHIKQQIIKDYGNLSKFLGYNLIQRELAADSVSIGCK